MMKFLIVDDRTENLYLLESLLKGSGYQVVTAGNGAEALEKLHGENFDMIISDILMPVMDGFHLCIKVKTDKNLKEIPFIFYTATYTDEKDEEAALKMGADGFIRKPAEPDELIKTIQNVLRDVKKGKIIPGTPSVKEDEDTFKLYSKRLVNKLEKKMLDLEREIIRRKKTEEALRVSEEKYRAFFDTSRDCAFITAQGGELLDINDAGMELFGLGSKEKYLKFNVQDFYENPEERKDHIQLIAKQGFAKDYPVNLIKKDGSIINSLITSVVKRDIYGNVIGFQGTVRDVTEKKKAEGELKESYVRFKTVMDNIDAFIYVADMDTYEILHVNKHGRETWGDIEGKICWQTIQAGQSGPCPFCSNDRLVDKYGNPTGVYNWEFQNTVTGRWYDCRDSAIRWMSGHLVRIEIATDVTERKLAEANLKQSHDKLQGALGGIINALAATSEWRDPYTAGHQRRVAELACAIAEEMNFSEKQIRGIHMSALIHDVGKINVPSEILSKPGQLTELELNIIKTHPQVGYDILKDIEFPWPIAQIILQHHERTDGSGYPHGISGEKICPEARILAVADVVEAMASHRPYRPALNIDKALEEISQNKGILYDPEAVDACLKIFADKRFNFEQKT